MNTKKLLNHEELEEHLAEERTTLAKKRTLFANERTLLSYIRTAFTIFLFGVAVMKLFELNQLAVYIGIIAIVFGCGVLFFGFTSSVTRNRKIKKL